MTSTSVTESTREAALRALGAPMSRRDMWLTIALAVARDGLPEPQRMSVDSGVYLDFDTQQQVERWTAYLDLTTDAAIDRAAGHNWDGKGGRWIIGAHGWPGLLDKTHVRISACVDHLDAVTEPSPLAAQVVAAIAPSGVDGFAINGRAS